MTILIKIDSFPTDEALSSLMNAAWGFNSNTQFGNTLRQCLVHVTAHHNDRLVGFAKLATDGCAHAFLLDPTVHPDHRHQGLGTRLVKTLIETAKQHDVQFIHVDFEPHLTQFYEKCGFSPTAAGLLRL